MKIAQKEFILVMESRSEIIIDDHLETLLREKVKPILWYRDGLFCLVTKELLQNTLNDIDNAEKQDKRQDKKFMIHWLQGCCIMHDVGIILSQLDL